MLGSNFKKELIKTGIVLTTGVAVAGGCWYSGYERANQTHKDNIFNSNVAQDVTEQSLKGTKIDAIIDSINTKLQLGLVEQSGVGTLKLEKYDAEWNKFLTTSQVEVSVEYKAMVGIEVKDLILHNDGDRLVVQYSTEDFKVLSIETLNENILANRSIFGTGYDDDDKVAIKKHIQEDTKQQIIDNEKIIRQANSELKEYLKDLADNFDVSVQIIDTK